MHNYIILIAVFLPLVGVFQMERGAFGMSIGMEGYPNGSTVMYAAYALVLIVSYSLSRNRKWAGDSSTVGPSGQNTIDFVIFSRRVWWLAALVLLVMLFGFGGWSVWTGAIGKGEFRANLGSFGSLAYLLINAVIPMLIAYAAVLYRQKPRRRREQARLGVLFLATLAIGSTWGFKSTGLTMLLPAIIILFWNAKLLKAVGLGIAALFMLIVFFYLFDTNTSEAEAGLWFLFTRLTVLQGDVAWYLWGAYQDGERFPSYLPTLLVFIGDTLFSSISGITRDVPDQWAAYHFDILVGVLVGLPLSVIEEGHSIVGTPFSDGLVMGGVPGILAMAGFAGVFTAVVCNALARSLRLGQTHLSALLATYFGIYVITFLRNGVVVQLFHVATVVGLLLALGLCLLSSARLMSGDRGRGDAHVSAVEARVLNLEKP